MKTLNPIMKQLMTVATYMSAYKGHECLPIPSKTETFRAVIKRNARLFRVKLLGLIVSGNCSIADGVSTETRFRIFVTAAADFVEERRLQNLMLMEPSAGLRHTFCSTIVELHKKELRMTIPSNRTS